jgi:hypothetical protein
VQRAQSSQLPNFPQLDGTPATVPPWGVPKRISKPKPDTVQNARRGALESLTDSKPAVQPVSRALVSQVMAAMGRKGGKIGGKRRLVTMTATRRRQVAKQAARVRWSKKKIQ